MGALAPYAHAQPKPGASKLELQAEARKRGEEGLKLFGEKKFAEAYEAFRQADEIFHANTLVLYMGHCRRDMGKFLEAREIFQKIIDEPVPKGALEQFKKAQKTASEELKGLSLRIPTLKVVFTGALASTVSVTLNGAPSSVSELSSGKEVDPGEYVIRVEAPGVVPVERTINVPEGAETNEGIDIVAKKADGPPKKGSIVPGAVLIGVGAAGVGVGAVTGIMAKSQIDDIKSRCLPSGHCLASDQANADAAERLTTASTISFAVGGAVLVTGAILFIVRPGGGKEPEKAASAGLHLSNVSVGLGSIHVGGTF